MTITFHSYAPLVKSYGVIYGVMYCIHALLPFLRFLRIPRNVIVTTFEILGIGQLKLSDNVAGVTLVAIGNGAPDIFSALSSFTATDPKVARLAIGSLLGAGMFVIMVVAGKKMLHTIAIL